MQCWYLQHKVVTPSLAESSPTDSCARLRKGLDTCRGSIRLRLGVTNSEGAVCFDGVVSGDEEAKTKKSALLLTRPPASGNFLAVYPVSPSR